MFSKWGMTTHMDEKEHLFESTGLAHKTGVSNAQKRKKKRCVVYAKK
jgi:hypothetical protein